MFVHTQTTIGRIRIDGDDCIISATIETMKVTRGGLFSGPDIYFTITVPKAEIENAYDCAIEEGRRVFQRFNAQQEAA